MTARTTETAAVAAAAGLLTMVIAAPVLRAPSQRIFGMEMVGRHYDPFTVMEQFTAPIRWTALLQPVTDLPGHAIAAWLGPVASYNVLVLSSFPLVAAAVYLLARHCAIAPAFAAGAALAVAFSPFHVAHAAYHLHVAQGQWVPLYLLALWRCLDRPAWRTAVVLMLAVAAVVLSNFYGGFIAAVITPVAVAAHWGLKRDRSVPMHGVALTSLVLVLAAGAAAAYAVIFAAGQTAVDFTPGDFLKYRAPWWRYLTPPVANPWLGESMRSNDPGLLEQQVSVGWAVTMLSIVAVTAWLYRRRTAVALSNVPVFAAVALVAFLCSISPTLLLTEPFPMFRSYARFGGVVQLMLAMLAALGAQWLWQSQRAAAKSVVLALAVLAVLEYAVWPPAMWRDVLPTAAHRWVTQQTATTHVFDCYDYSRESQSVQWLTAGRVILRERSVGDCREPGVIAMLAATGFTHLLVRHDTPDGKWFEGRPPPAGLRLAARFDDAEVFAVTEGPSLIRTTETQAFYPAEFDHASAWRWMGTQASWTVVNSSARFLLASVDVEVNAFHEPRSLAVYLDGAAVQEISVEPQRNTRRLGPLALPPGTHTLVFRSNASTNAAGEVLHNGDPRRLSIAFGDWQWSVGGDRP